jgi:hypothetical protein
LLALAHFIAPSLLGLMTALIGRFVSNTAPQYHHWFRRWLVESKEHSASRYSSPVEILLELSSAIFDELWSAGITRSG